MTDTRAIERTTAHRPWPKPDRPWLMFQSWQRLLFAHWPVPASVLRPHIPEPLVLEEFDGSAWIGLTPFLVARLHPRLLPPLPGLSTFPEMNLRTYVRFDGTPGVFFFTLEAASRLAVFAARVFFRLPYHLARMEIEEREGWTGYRSRRRGDGAAFVGRYRPTGPVFHAERGTLEHFLIERYALFSVLEGGDVLRGDIHHEPWPIQTAEAEIEVNSVAARHGIELPREAPLVHYAARQDTLIWRPTWRKGHAHVSSPAQEARAGG